MSGPLRPAAEVRTRSRVWMVGFPAVFGAVLGGLGGALWWQVAGPGGVCDSGDDNNECLSYFFLLPVVLVLGIGISWVILALATNAWMAPTITLGGSAAATYCLSFYQSITPVGHTAPPMFVAVDWALCYGTVAFACLPGLSRIVRGVVIVLLLLPALANLIL